MMLEEDEEICRVCRSTASPDKPLFHPCICTGSIRHVHQECLMQWLQHSRKEYCELCNYKYSFKPIYSPDMPNRLPLRDLFFGLLKSVGSAVKCWIHYTVVAIAWLGIVPLTASRIYNCVFAGSVAALASLPMDMLSTQNITTDILRGCLIVTCTLSAFIALIWLRVQVLNEDLPAWLVHRFEEQIPPEMNNNQNDNNQDLHVEPIDNTNEQNDNFEAPPDNNGEDVNDADVNWADVERDVEDPSWERIMGLDGSFLFVEHVFWVIALNTLFILVFAFCPYHLGHFFLFFIDLHSYAKATKFEGVLTALCGYVLVAFAFLLCHIVLQICRFYWSGRVFGLCYIILKVGLLVLVEIGIFPLLCGIWLDICTLKIFNCTLEDRHVSYFNSPGIAIFLHWVIGMMFVYYFANFLMMAKEVLKPGALWFLRNLNDPDFNPINEMIHLSIYKYCRRFLLSTMIFGSTIVILAWVPANLLVFLVPNLVPLSTTMNTSIIGEFCLQILTLQLTVPNVLEHKKTKTCLRNLIIKWSSIFGGILGVRSYLLYDNHLANKETGDNDPAARFGPVGVRGSENRNALNNLDQNQTYIKPPFFPLRITFLLLFVAVTFAFTSFVIMVVPVSIGRIVTGLVFGREFFQIVFTNNMQFKLHDTYNFLLGLYCCWSCACLYWTFTVWLPCGWNTIKEKLRDGCFLCIKSLTLTLLLLVILPSLIGTLMDLVILIPLTVPLHKTPVLNIVHDWGAGVIAQIVLLVIVLAGPRSWLKDDLERAYQQGIRQLPLLEFVNGTCMPIIVVVLLFLCLPYAIGHSIPTLFDCDPTTEHFFKWRTYPLLIFGVNVIAICWYEVKQFYRLCDHIKNERYLIGRRLQDYNP